MDTRFESPPIYNYRSCVSRKFRNSILSFELEAFVLIPSCFCRKYHLLLQRFLKSIEADTATYKKVQEALELMKAVNDQINKDMPEFSPNDKLSNTIDVEQLTELFGCVLKQGDLVLSQTKTTHHVILLQNMLVIRKAVPSNKIMHMIAVSCRKPFKKGSCS